MTLAPEMRIADAVADAWHGNPYSGRLTIPFSAVATMTLLQTDSHASKSSILNYWKTCSDGEMMATVRQLWNALWIVQPFVAYLARPLHEWITGDTEPDKEALGGFREVAAAALRAGVLDITGFDDPARRDSADVLGAVLTRLRAPGDIQARGEYHTPADVAEVLSRIVLTSLPAAGESLYEPTSGTGGAFREVARRIRALGGNPADYPWAMTDLDELAVAGAALNSYLWGLAAPLGTNMLLLRCDVLAVADGPERAAVVRGHVLNDYASAVRRARQIAAVKGALSLHRPATTRGRARAVAERHPR